MKTPLLVTIRDISDTPAIEAKLQEHAEKLDQFYNHIDSCRVVVEAAQKHKHQGKLYNVRIDLTVPGKELVVNRAVNEDLYIAIGDAFDAAQRLLEEHAQEQRGQVKNHSCLYGKIVRLFLERDYGFIRTDDGTEYYFSSNNVKNLEFDKLKIGMEVEFFEVIAGDGLQANHVVVVGRNR